MATQVKMPQLGETVVEGTITRWLKREGESVGMDEPLVEVSTDKVDSEIPSPVSGTVSRIHAGEGETVTVGSVIAEIAGAGEEAPPAAPTSTPRTEKTPVPAPGASEAAAAAPAPAPAHEPAPATAVAYAAPPSGGDEVVPVSHMRKSIAEHMVASNIETARAWNAVEVDMTRIFNLRRQAGAAFKEREGFSLTWMPFVAKAVTQALLKYPQVNATWNGDGTITRKHYVNLGIAVALANGLIVPVLKNADGMNLVGLARSIRDL